MRPTTPNFQNVAPTSPPQTPRNTSPTKAYVQRHVNQPKAPDSGSSFHHPANLARPLSQMSSIKPTGNGHHFSYTRPNQLSPRSSSSSSTVPSDSDSDSDQSSVGPQPISPDCPIPSVERALGSGDGIPPVIHTAVNIDANVEANAEANGDADADAHLYHASHEVRQPVRVVAITEVSFEVEELESDYDPDDGGSGEISIIRPCGIEYPESERSHSPSRFIPSFANMGINGFRSMGIHMAAAVADDDDDDESIDADNYRRILQQIREQKRRRRMTSGSIGKRTISESIGSDTDNEDVICFGGADEVGSSARRLRRKYERHSFIFQDPPPPRIDEMDEPPTTDDEDDLPEVEIFGKELPYWTMEIDSP